MSLRRMLSTIVLAALPCTVSCNRVQMPVQAKESKMPSVAMKKVSIGRLDLQVPANAELKTIGQVKEVNLTVDRLPNGQTFAAAWAGRVKKIASGSGNDPNPGQTVVRKSYPAAADHGQVYYEQGKDAQILVVMERWQMIGNVLVKGREEFEPKYLPDVERDMEAVFGHMSQQAPVTREDFAVGPITVRQSSQGGAEHADASIAMTWPGGDGQPVKASLRVSLQVLSSPGSITVLNRAKQSAQGSGLPDVETKLLRASKRSVHGMDGEESVLSYTQKGVSTTTLRAEWGTPGKPGDDHAPQTELTFGVENGHLSVPEALGFWDSIVSSLQYRQ